MEQDTHDPQPAPPVATPLHAEADNSLISAIQAPHISAPPKIAWWRHRNVILIVCCVLVALVLVPPLVLALLHNAQVRGENAVLSLELVNTQARLELYAVEHGDVYPETLEGMTEHQELFEYTVSSDRKSFQLCKTAKTASDNCRTGQIAHAVSVAGSCSALPPVDTSTEYDVRIAELTDLLNTMLTDEVTEDTFTKYQALENELQAIVSEQTLVVGPRMYSAVGESRFDSIYQKYCAQGVAPVAIASSASTSYWVSAEQMTQYDPVQLACMLDTESPSSEEIPLALGQLSATLAQGNDFESAVLYYTCAGDRYSDLFSMLKLAQLYYHGSTKLLTDTPEFLPKTEIPPDFEKAYFWTLAIFYTEQALNGGSTDERNMSQFWWNTIALLDSLQQGKGLTASDMQRIEGDVQERIHRLFPSVDLSKTNLYAHSMGAIVDALEDEKATSNNSAIGSTEPATEIYDEYYGFQTNLIDAWGVQAYMSDSARIIVSSPETPKTTNPIASIKIIIAPYAGTLEDAVAWSKDGRLKGFPGISDTSVKAEQTTTVSKHDAAFTEYHYTHESKGSSKTLEYIAIANGYQYIYTLSGTDSYVEKYRDSFKTAVLSTTLFEPIRSNFTNRYKKNKLQIDTGHFTSQKNSTGFFYPPEFHVEVVPLTRTNGTSEQHGAQYSFINVSGDDSMSGALTIYDPSTVKTSLEKLENNLRLQLTQSFGSDTLEITEKEVVFLEWPARRYELEHTDNLGVKTTYGFYVGYVNGYEYQFFFTSKTDVWSMTERYLDFLANNIIVYN